MTKTRLVDVQIVHEKTGEVIFEKPGFEVPEQWSDNAAIVVASRYAIDHENSALAIINRVAAAITTFGEDQGYFPAQPDADDFYASLRDILINQRAALNSPVFFNAGVEENSQNFSACYILPVEDNMEDILEHTKRIGMIFKGGAGAGVNVSKLRAEGELLSNKGFSSGPLSFMRMWDSCAGSIRSGGKNRRSAALICMDVDHPDIMKFIECKWHEEQKALLLMDNGVDPEEAYSTIDFQNANHSIMVYDDFMEGETWGLNNRGDGKCVEILPARTILHKAAETAWYCGDPGVMFYDRINRDNPVPSIDNIRCGNPCIEFNSVDNSSCNLASMNLVKYWDAISINGDMGFSWTQFEADIKVMITAMDILIEAGEYPTPEIRETTLKTRPLGLGFTNLGALLMLRGLPYDSDEARNIASTITSMMTLNAYRQSIELASRLGSFPAFEENQDQCADIIHRLIPEHLGPEDLVSDIEEHGLRNSQLTLLAPTGCIHPNSLILTSEGVVPIGSLHSKEAQWEDINITVIQENKKTVATKAFYNGLQNTIKITTCDGYYLEGTPDHKVRILNDSGEYLWKELQQLSINDHLTIRSGGHEEILCDKPYIQLKQIHKSTHHACKPCIIPEILEEKLAYILGLYMADGCLHYSKETPDAVRIFLGNHETEIEDTLVEYTKNIFGIDCTTETRRGCTGHCIVSRNIGKFFKENGFGKARGVHGNGAASAFIPIQILQSKTSVLCNFIRGYFDGDGTMQSTSRNNHGACLEFSTVSKRMASTLQTCLLSLGIRTRVTKREINTSKRFGRRPIYRIRVRSKHDLMVYASKIGFTDPGHTEQLVDYPIRERRANAISCKQAWDELWTFREQILYLDGCMLSQCRRLGFGSEMFARQLINKYQFLQNTLMANLINKNLFTDQITSIIPGECETYDISVPENNTYIANGFVSHNTISLMMDCDSTGIEPLFALQTTKTLAGGGTITISPTCVSIAMGREDHKDVFKTAGEIHWKDHILMVAACQQHLNGSVSKTVNMPTDATVDDIEEAYIFAWEHGLKAISVYRDGSKRLQPLREKTEEVEEEEITSDEDSWTAYRKRLPETRQSITHKFNISGFEGYITASAYEDGDPGELFIRAEKSGSTMTGFLDSFSIAISMALQYGVPLESFINKFSGSRFEPAGFTQNEDIRMTTSVMDYVFRWLKLTFLDDEDEEPEATDSSIAATPKINTNNLTFDGPPCQYCGSITHRSGTCYLCSACGNNSGGCS